MTNKERAEKLVAEWSFRIDTSFNSDVKDAITAALEDAETRGWNAGVELAAKESYLGALEMTSFMGLNDEKRVRLARKFCDDIRALKSPERSGV